MGMMIKAYFSRDIDWYLISADAGNDPNYSDKLFSAVLVDVPEETLKFCNDARRLKDIMDNTFLDNPAYEDCAQKEADVLDTLISELVV
jgi:hypothetical protein